MGGWGPTHAAADIQGVGTGEGSYGAAAPQPAPWQSAAKHARSENKDLKETRGFKV